MSVLTSVEGRDAVLGSWSHDFIGRMPLQEVVDLLLDGCRQARADLAGVPLHDRNALWLVTIAGGALANPRDIRTPELMFKHFSRTFLRQ